MLQLLGREVVEAFQFEVVRKELVSGDLLLDEAVVGLVVVEGLDRVVPIAPGVGMVVLGVGSAVGVPDDIQPMLPPAFPVTGRFEQFLDELFVGIG